MIQYRKHKKEEALRAWQQAEAKPLTMTPIPYKAEGSSYGADQVRITGSPEFVEAVLARLKPLLAHENGETRLGLSLNPVDGSSLKKKFHKAAPQAMSCYITCNERGPEAKMLACYCPHPDLLAEADRSKLI